MSVARTTELSPIKRAFLALEQSDARLKAAEAAAREPIAVIGLGCRLPGADDPEAFWQLLRDGVDAVGPVPDNRFNLDSLHDAAARDAPDAEIFGKSVTREAGFLREVDQFDPVFFGITHREARGMDPQQRLLLEVSWEALENAGAAPDTLERTATGVYFGVCSNDYANLQLQANDPALLDSHYTSGLAHSVASGRVSYTLGLQGPSITVDTACSSSLVAVHLACQALRAGDCRMALAGGVNMMLSPDLFVAFSNTRMLAADGRCKTFDSSADGFGRGEGCGVVVLKRLSDAQSSGDRVLAVIRGSAVNQDGPSSGLTAPNGPAQEAVIREALARAGLSPRQVGYVEAHGTGTQLGDPLEVQALGAVFGRDRAGTPELLIGSVKTNFGHLEAAAGVTGLIKLILSLRHRAIPPNLHFCEPNPHIAWGEFPLRVATELMPWAPIEGRRIGAVSSFGFSGTNAHLLVEEAPEIAANAVVAEERGQQLFVLSARDQTALAALARRYANEFSLRNDDDLADICFSASVAKAQHPHRAAVLARSLSELVDRLTALAEGRSCEGVRTARVTRRDPPRIAFLFTGQGAQYAGMAHQLDAQQPAFRTALDRCARVLDPLLQRPLRDLLFDQSIPSQLDQTGFTQPALFALEYALSEMWRAWGVVPHVAIGHSVGELVAACVAGAISLEDALSLTAERGRLMQSLPVGGAMAAVNAPESLVAAAMQGQEKTLAIAAINGPEQSVISGDAAAVRALSSRFIEQGIRCQALEVSHAFHSPLVDPMLDAFEAAASKVVFSKPRLRVISNLHGAPADPTEIMQPRYWRRHAREAVRFADGIRALAAMEPDLCIEVGPQPTLLSFVGAMSTVFGDRMPAMVASLRKGRSDSDQITEALAMLFVAGVAVDWRAVWAARPQRLVDLPSYPFQRERCWFQARGPSPRASGKTNGVASGHPLLGTRLRSALRDVVLFEQSMRSDDFVFLRDHQVQGRAILPATAFIELAIAAYREVFDSEATLRGMTIADPLVFEGEQERIVQVVVRRSDGGGASFEILSSVSSAASDWRSHAQGTLERAEPVTSLQTARLDQASIEARCSERVDAPTHYARLSKHGLAFGPSLRGVREIRRRDGEAFGEIELPNETSAGHGSYLLNPALLDACLQCLAWALPSSLTQQKAWLPLAIEQFVRIRAAGRKIWSHAVLTDAGSSGNATIRADLRVYDEDGLVAELRGIVLRPTSRSEAVASPFYEVAWQIDDRKREDGVSWLPAPRTLENEIGSRLEPLARQHDLEGYHRATVALDAYCGAWIARAFVELGWSPRVGERVSSDDLGERLGVAPRYRRLLVRLLDILVEDGLLARDKATDEAGWVVLRASLESAAPASIAGLRADHPESAARFKLVQACAEFLPTLLRGEADPLQRLFPNGSTADVEALYRDSPESKVYNELARDAVQVALRSLPAARRLRVLEIGGGTGGTTSWLAPVMPERSEYLFTDISPLLVAKARERFAAHAFMHFQTFDVEKDPASQGIESGQFDLVIAANVVHATADLRATLERVRSLLAPGGMLLLLEIGGRERWVDVTFGFTDGWWRFTDVGLRPDYPLLNRATWLELLAASGFEAAVLNPVHRGSNELLMAARRPLKQESVLPTGRRWLVLADEGSVGTVMAQRLCADGKQVTVLRCRPSKYAGVNDRLIEASTVHEMRRALEPAVADVDGIVHLWALDLPALNDADPNLPAREQQVQLGSLLALVQALGTQSFPSGGTPRLWVVTRGAQAAEETDELALAQSPSWGMGRVIALEHPELKPTWIDLDPNSTAAVQANDLLRTIAAANDELQITVRAGTAYVARLEHSQAGRPISAPHCVRLEKPKSGLLEELLLRPATRRDLRPGEIEIRVHATGLNFRDLMNAVAMREDPEPLGGECAGRITAVGPDVTALAVGDDVVALAEDCFATFAVCDSHSAVRLPPGLGYAAATTLPFAFMTAHHALFDLGKIKAGDTVLIHAAAGGVGSAAVQLALRAGAIVIGTAGSESKRAHLLASGVHHALDSRTLGFDGSVLNLTDGRGVDLVINSLAGEFIDASVNCLAQHGCFLEIGKRDIWSTERFHKLRPKARYFAIDLAAMRCHDQIAWLRLFTDVIDAATRGDLQALPMRLFPLERAADAFRCMAQARHIGKIVLTQCDDRINWPDELSPDATYLITGGLRGLGLATAEHLVAKGARHVVLVGRHPVGMANEASLATLHSLGAQIRVIQADVSDCNEVARVLATIEAELPPLRGIVHSAGVLADAAILQQDWSRFTQVLGPKVDGSWALHVLTKGLRLDFFVMYSSVASVFGSAGQANHAAANAFIDALAAHRRALGLPALSIGWGGWSGIGSAADRGLHDRLGVKGIGSITPERGLEMFDTLMRSAPAHVAACPIDWPVLLQQHRDTAFFEHMRGQSARSSRAKSPSAAASTPSKSMAATAAAARTEWLAALRAAQPARRDDMLLTFVGEQVASVIGLPDGMSVDLSQPLNELGLDSLMAVELRNRLGNGLALERSLPATLVFDRPTIEALAGYLGDVLVQAVAPPFLPVRPDAGPDRRPVADAVEAIDGLSEEQIEELFERKLRSQ
ncbi:MAG: SDR family NAD(P)-dependent oxidoreductase [Xanthobacteraceae bacterium]|nr:SDR family NAD(P)-dependent oxidoreductase [Xanthobacteraceae bacterium]